MDENTPQSKKNDIKTIHTYLTDMAETVRDNETSVIKIAIAEQNKHEREDLYRKAEGTNLTKTLLIAGGIILVLGACVAIYFVIQKNQNVNSPTTAPISINNFGSIISYENQSFVDTTQAINKTDLAALINPEVAKVGKPDSILSIFLTSSESGKPEILKLKDFVYLMGITAPESLIRSLSGSYMIGSYTPATVNENNKPHLFLLFEVKDYNLVYAGMLDWEKTMLDDMYNLFNVDVSGDRSYIFETPFRDIVINNRDARILFDKNGDDILYYSFIDKNNLIISDDQDTIKKVSSRLIIKRTKPL